MSTSLPTTVVVANLLTDLLGQKTTSKSATATPQPLSQAVAEYRDAGQALRAIATCDMAVGASFAAALTMVPPARVDECIKDKKLDQPLAENLYEVFNVLAAAFPKSGADRVILRAVHHDGKLPDDALALMTKPRQRIDMDIAVNGYRSGKLVFLIP